MAKTYATVIDAVEGILRDALRVEEPEVKRTLREVGDLRSESIGNALSAAREAIGASTIPPPPSARSAKGVSLKVKPGRVPSGPKDRSDAAYAPTMRAPAQESAMKKRLRMKRKGKC